ncbi:hypothetical protein LTR91_012998 [Friedmanniomyces endolithicus]|uniref:N-acetyltransferase domain-containing protein n=2 Tax=Friedmanniomyces endolithicus TaxID=329885 RepID=A0AAN6FST7_9PEZI|nr:hypothetical protein LTS09_007194 [Friedmanniomyces endolithicus]KAK0281746.1 hypothetical protein LTR35_007427 [Friedmanniomyces endolithicus]KAK0297261.1 hypothetical protein LTS00_003982 [Friedmanniomyces endolithicus]KAK0315598.1 hypothetical protein LTR01_000898 [Friedmanniomyces endolithicus]KAK0322908.1 hypothetical protein LTR82_005836 [Friedmanniomyces endolithicus]
MADFGNAELEAPPLKVIETERLCLRTLQLTDAEAFLPIISRPEVMQWTYQDPITDLEQAERWLSARALGPGVFNFAIELRDRSKTSTTTPDIIGVCGSYHWPQKVMIGVIDHFGKGYATEALRAVIPALFERMPLASIGDTGFDYIEGRTAVENKASQRVLEKAGLSYCETGLQDFENPLRGKSDSVWYRIARPGKTLRELGLIPREVNEDDDKPPTPPIQ